MEIHASNKHTTGIMCNLYAFNFSSSYRWWIGDPPVNLTSSSTWQGHNSPADYTLWKTVKPHKNRPNQESDPGE